MNEWMNEWMNGWMDVMDIFMQTELLNFSIVIGQRHWRS